MHVTASYISNMLQPLQMVQRFILLATLLLPAVSAAQDQSRASWDQWLDSAYQLTWHDRADIKKWIREKEATVFDTPLHVFVQKQEAKLAGIDRSAQQQTVSDEALIQLAIAELLLYLQNADSAYLEKAARTINSLNPDAVREKPETAFWFYYINSHSSIEKGDAAGFVNHIFGIWLDVLLKVEAAAGTMETKAADSPLHGFFRSPSYLHRNLANLILQRAIVQHRMLNIDALGVIIRNLSFRMPPTGYGKWVAQVVGYMDGPDSETFRLVFAVQLIEAERKRISLEQLIASQKTDPTIVPELTDLFSCYAMLNEISHTRHGRIVAAVKQLQLSSFVLSTVDPTRKSHQEIVSIIPIRKNPSNNVSTSEELFPDMAIRLFDELALMAKNRETQFQAGFISEQRYLSAMHDLWRAIMNFCLDSAVFYNRQIDSGSAAILRLNIPVLEQILLRYLDLFTRHAGSVYKPIVPDNAFYGAAEADEMLSDVYFLSAQWEAGLKKYDWALARRVQALEIYPFGVSDYQILAQRLTELGRLDQYRKYVAPQADRIRHSRLIQAAAIPQNQYLGDELIRLVTVLPEVIERAPYSIVLHQGLPQVPQALLNRLASIETEIQTLLQEGESRNHIIDTIQNLKKKLAAQKVLTDETVPVIARDIEYLASLIEKNPVAQPETKSDRQLPSFDSGLFADDLPGTVQELRQIKEECIILQQLPDMNALRNRLVMETDHPFHTLLRKLYYETASPQSNSPPPPAPAT